MHRLLERLDGAASTFVPLLYLAGLALGAASYFAGITLAGENAGVAVGIALAAAAELHSFLQQRRVRATWAQLQRLNVTNEDTPEREAISQRLQVEAGILLALLVFSAFNATAFVAATWHPTSGWLPPWLQIGIRGCVIPAFFFAAGFLSPLHTDASEQLHATSTSMLRRTLKAIDKQWKQRLAQAQKRNADLAPIAIALLEDAGDTDGARRVQLIAAGLEATATTTATTSHDQREMGVAYARAMAANAPVAPPNRVENVPTIAAYEGAGGLLGTQMTHHTIGAIAATGGLPSEALEGPQTAGPVSSIPPEDDPPPGPKRSRELASKPSNISDLRRGYGKPPRRDRRMSSRANAKAGARGQVEARIRRLLEREPGLTHAEVVRRTGASSSTVSKWLQVIRSEQSASGRTAQQA